MPGILKSVIDEVIMRTDIVSLISGYVSLKRAGNMHKGLCPFHSEKSPSFTVYPATNSFYCFGCGIGGDAITFTKQIEHLDYPDAVEFLARRAGITVIRDDNSLIPSQPRYDKEKMFKMNVDAANFFHNALFADTPEAKAALAYFTEKRQLSLATIKHFGLGYAPNSFDVFSKYMTAKGYTYDELVAGFLCGKSEKGSYYDAFRNRVMFPIIDVAGNVIAFGGRVLDDTKPKYKNSSDTPVFKKSRNLFALNFARQTCGEALVLCEGYMDVIALHSAGFTNAVATLGTAITPEQARLMSRYTKKVIICYDSDEAGQTATAKALKILADVGLDTRVVVVPGSKDPDEYIKTFGKDKFKEVLEGAKLEFSYKMDNVLSRYDITLDHDRVKALGELENIISEVYSEAERDIYIQNVAKKLGVDPKSVKGDIVRIIGKKQRSYIKSEGQRALQSAAGYSDKINRDFAKAPTVAKHEEVILGLLLLFPEHRKLVFEEGLLDDNSFFTEFNKRVFISIRDAYENTDQTYDPNESFTPEEVGRITKMKLTRMSLTENGEDILRESINSLKSSMEKRSARETSTASDLESLISKFRSED